MPTMFDALSDGSLDLQNKRDLSSDFARQIVKHRDAIVSDYLKHDIDLSQAISKIAKRDNLNDDQIHRIVEEVNNQVYLAKYSQLKGSNERDVNFNLASVQKIKELCGHKTEEKEDSKEETSGDKKIEKKASEESKMNIFNGTSYTYGNLAPHMKLSKEEFITEKIAFRMMDQQDKMEKIAKNVKVSTLEVADALVLLDRNGADVNNVLSKIARDLSFSDAEVGMIKEACERRIGSLIESRSIPSHYKLELDASLDKTASEKFSLGSFSLSKNANENLPSVLTLNNKKVSCMNDMMKLASTFKNGIGELKTERDSYVEMLSKCAEVGLNVDEFEKQAGMTSNFFQMC